MTTFFLDRPIVAWCLALITMLAGAIMIFRLPVSQYPTVAPPSVVVTASYPGASAETAQVAVAQVIEQQFSGIDGLLYFSSSIATNGQVQITATFEPGTDADIAQVQIQNRVQTAAPLLPAAVQQLGISVAKARTNQALVLAVYDSSGRYNSNDIADYMISHLQPALAQVGGVGSLQSLGAQHAMRIWLDPDKLAGLKLMPSDVRAAVLRQNVEISAGEIGGQPIARSQRMNATITSRSRLQTPEQFGNIVVRAGGDGAIIRLRDVARIELGSENYDLVSRLNGRPAAGMVVLLAPNANALDVVNQVKARANELSRNFPPGLHLAFPLDSTTTIRASITNTVRTLVESIVLVVIVMYLFLRNWRATLIPAIAVPIVILGTFAVIGVLGYSINTLSLFGIILVTGLLVDDAIIVVENVQRLMVEDGLDAKAATRKSMHEITGALVGVGLVLSAIFAPMAFFDGSPGVIYRQFAITMTAAIVLSVLVALILTPTLCASLLVTKPGSSAKGAGRSAIMLQRYDRALGWVFRRPVVGIVAYGVIVIAAIWLTTRLPDGFLPDEDQGAVIAVAIGPAGSTQPQSSAALDKVEKYFANSEKGNVESIFSVAGYGPSGISQNTGIAFILLKDWSERNGSEGNAALIAQRAMGGLSSLPHSLAFAIVPPPIPELGAAAGFEMQLVNEGGLDRAEFRRARDQLLAAAAKNPAFQGVRPSALEDAPQLHVDIDTEQAEALGISQADLSETMSAGWSPSYINDFVDNGRIKRVLMQGEGATRTSPDDIGRWHVRNAHGEMVPLSAVTATRWAMGSSQLQRFNGFPAYQIQGMAAPGHSSGEAIRELERLGAQLPPGVQIEWSGLSFQETRSGSQVLPLYSITILVIFIALASLYGSWSIPLSVILVFPLGIIGAIAAATLRDLNNDIYLQVALLTTMGLAAKNAILIVEFAVDAEKRGVGPRAAAIEAANLRLRPILMTSLAFVAGVLPLAFASGAGAGSRIVIGTAVVGGMISATLLTVILMPLLYVLVRHGTDKLRKFRLPARPEQ